MTKKIIAGGCSFTFGSELSDDDKGRIPSKKSWAHLLKENTDWEYICAARAGAGNSGIARRVFNAMTSCDKDDIGGVVVMWSFLSRYDWAMPRHQALEATRWASISPWDTDTGHEEAFRHLSGSEAQQEKWKVHRETFLQTGVKDLAEAIYKYGANRYHESYLSWKSIVWLQNLLDKKRIPYMFTLADNSLFYHEMSHLKEQDSFMEALHGEIDFTNWFSFGERMMGFNQWAILNGYERGTTHPLDQAHQDAVKLMIPTYKKLILGETQ